MINKRNYFTNLYGQVQSNSSQSAAINHSGNVVVQAGPGSGKTRLATVKAALALIEEEKVACISYSRVAAQKMRGEFLKFGIHEENIFFGTVHSFCLQFILRRYLHLYIADLPQPWSMLIDSWVIPTPQRIKELMEVHDIRASQFELRRARFNRYEAPNSETPFILKTYDLTMIEAGFLDFDMIAELALLIIKIDPQLGKSIAHHFDIVIIDEYQDLGVIFHEIVLILSQTTDITFFVVGDANQAIHVDSGGMYLKSLRHNGFRDIVADTCYRFSQKITDKSLKILDTEVNYFSDSSTYHDGDINIFNLPYRQKLDPQEQIAEFVTELLEKIIKRGNNFGDIAILYSARSNKRYNYRVPNLVVEKLASLNSIDFVDEKTIRLANTPLIDWIQECASWCFSDSVKRPYTLQHLSNYYENLYMANKVLLDSDEIREKRLKLRDCLLYLRTLRDTTFDIWINELNNRLEIRDLINEYGDITGELQELDKLCMIDQPATRLATNYDLNKVKFTTIHSSKGRQFKYVIVLGAQLGLVPWKNYDGTLQRVEHFRKLLYVALTRATHQTYVITSSSIADGKSPFLNRIQEEN